MCPKGKSRYFVNGQVQHLLASEPSDSLSCQRLQTAVTLNIVASKSFSGLQFHQGKDGRTVGFRFGATMTQNTVSVPQSIWFVRRRPIVPTTVIELQRGNSQTVCLILVDVGPKLGNECLYSR